MIGLLADSHDNVPAVRRAVRLFKDADCSLVLHAGDIVAPFAARELGALLCPVRAVFGNCDGERRGLEAVFAGFRGTIRPSPAVLEHEGRRIILAHAEGDAGRLAPPRSGDILVCGHTHRPETRQAADGVLVVNPGEAGGWLHARCTAALLDPRDLRVEIVALA